jgi:hypothetical protein
LGWVKWTECEEEKKAKKKAKKKKVDDMYVLLRGDVLTKETYFARECI